MGQGAVAVTGREMGKGAGRKPGDPKPTSVERRWDNFVVKYAD